MNSNEASLDAEVAAIQAVVEALSPLETDSRQRVLEYVAARFGSTVQRARSDSQQDAATRDEDESLEGRRKSAEGPSFETLAELFDAARPRSNPDKALVAAYWVQVCRGSESFASASINKELKNLGHGLSNVTDAINGLKKRKPAPVVQLKKSGKSRQARTIHKVTDTGIRTVEKMIGGSS